MNVTIDNWPSRVFVYFQGTLSTRVLFSKAFSDCIKRYGFSIETSRKHLPLFSSIFLLLFGEQETKLDRVRFSHPILNAIKSIVNVLTNKSLKITFIRVFFSVSGTLIINCYFKHYLFFPFLSLKKLKYFDILFQNFKINLWWEKVLLRYYIKYFLIQTYYNQYPRKIDVNVSKFSIHAWKMWLKNMNNTSSWYKSLPPI